MIKLKKCEDGVLEFDSRNGLAVLYQLNEPKENKSIWLQCDPNRVFKREVINLLEDVNEVVLSRD